MKGEPQEAKRSDTLFPKTEIYGAGRVGWKPPEQGLGARPARSPSAFAPSPRPRRRMARRARIPSRRPPPPLRPFRPSPPLPRRRGRPRWPPPSAGSGARPAWDRHRPARAKVSERVPPPPSRQDREEQVDHRRQSRAPRRDRKSTRLNSSN